MKAFLPFSVAAAICSTMAAAALYEQARDVVATFTRIREGGRETVLTPILESVRQAARIVLERQKSMAYLPIPGSPAYASAVQRLMFGEGHEVETSGRGGSLLGRAWAFEAWWRDPSHVCAGGPYFDRGTRRCR